MYADHNYINHAVKMVHATIHFEVTPAVAVERLLIHLCFILLFTMTKSAMHSRPQQGDLTAGNI